MAVEYPTLSPRTPGSIRLVPSDNKSHPSPAKLDFEFTETCESVRLNYGILSKLLQIRVDRWLGALEAPCSTTRAKKNRNDFAALLLQACVTRDFREPFHRLPPEDGRVPTLPTHLRARIPARSKLMPCEHPFSFSSSFSPTSTSYASPRPRKRLEVHPHVTSPATVVCHQAELSEVQQLREELKRQAMAHRLEIERLHQLYRAQIQNLTDAYMEEKWQNDSRVHRVANTNFPPPAPEKLPEYFDYIAAFQSECRSALSGQKADPKGL
ncbi:unnamed protein product [Chrysoparadoxa australica]